MKNLLLISILIIALNISCDKDDETEGSFKMSNISEVSFSFDYTYIYSNSEVIIGTNKFCDLSNTKIMFGENEAEVVSNRSNEIKIVTPTYVKDTVSLTIENGSTKRVIKDMLRMYPGGVSFEEVEMAPYEGRSIGGTFMKNGKGYVYDGSIYLGYYADEPDTFLYYHTRYLDDIWEYDLVSGGWNERSKEEIWDFEYSYNYERTHTKVFIGDTAYYVDTRTGSGDSLTKVVIERYYPGSLTGQDVFSYDFYNYPDIKFAFQHEDNIYMGIFFYPREDYPTEVWRYNTKENSLSFLFRFDTDVSGWMDYCFTHGSILYFFVNVSRTVSPDQASIDAPGIFMYQYNLDYNELREIDLTDCPINSFCSSPAFSFDSCGVIGEGVQANGKLFKYSNRFFKLTPK